MKQIDLSNVKCPNCNSLGNLYVFTPVDSNFKAVRCNICYWWTWLKNFNKKKILVIDESCDLPDDIWEKE